MIKYNEKDKKIWCRNKNINKYHIEIVKTHKNYVHQLI